MLVWDIWTQEMDSIHDMGDVNTDAVYYHSKTPEKCLEPLIAKRRGSSSMIA